ncbi:hypothetical protein BDR07DRAFT_1392751 [Suillus spraguei]|nr:hypothetical protein BDR07DRAFT_1392751 [Suillus spraguei]
MSRYPHDQDYHSSRSRPSGQQYARGDVYNTRYGQDEHSRQSADDQNHYRMQLNNYLQRRFGTAGPQGLRLDKSSSGPEHAPCWTVIVYFRDYEYGRGQATSKTSAREIACQMALQALMQPGIGH